MTTILDLLNQSLLLCGMRASGETVDAALAQDSLHTLHQMMSAWKLDALLVYQIDRVVVAMSTSQTYTVGVGGTINIARPVRLDRVNWRDESQTPALELPLPAMADADYQALRVRETSASMPTQFYYDQAYPLGTLFLWPRPTQTKQLVLFPWHPWDATMVLSDTVMLPPGYERLLVFALAVELSAQPGARLSPVALKIAEDARRLIENSNAEIPRLSLPHALYGGRGTGGWNPLTGD
jgi:hypothetical protein